MSLGGYLQLMRPANVTTALADVLAGLAISGLVNLDAAPWLLAATACLYAGGVVLNDVFDRRIDRSERPERPIPSGRVSAARAATLGGLLLASGVLLASRATPAAGAAALAIVTLVLLYDVWAKHRPFLGPLVMGSCRALNLLLGVAAVPAALRTAWPVALIPLTYIAAVTALSRGEVHGGKRGVALLALVSLGLVLMALLALALAPGHRSPVGLLLTALLGWRVVPPFWNAWIDPGPAAIRHAIKTGVLSLVLVDAVLGASFAGPLVGVAILATAPLAWWLSRLFSVT